MTDTITGRPAARLCSLPGCGQPATLQWQRAATEDETAAYLDGILTQVADAHAYEAVRHQIRIGELEQLTAQLPATAEGEHVRRLVSDNLAETHAELDRISDRAPVSVDHHLPVTIAVFGCEEHRPDDDHAAVVHAEHCLTADPCGCPRRPPRMDPSGE